MPKTRNNSKQGELNRSLTAFSSNSLPDYDSEVSNQDIVDNSLNSYDTEDQSKTALLRSSSEGAEERVWSPRTNRRPTLSIRAPQEIFGAVKAQAGIDLEDIIIPSPAPRIISRTEHFIAATMSGGERQMWGLNGKPLVYMYRRHIAYISR